MPFPKSFLPALLLLPATLALGQVGFTTHNLTAYTGSPELRAADLNHDGFADLVTGSGTVYLGDGQGGFDQGAQLPAQGGIYEVQIADLNGDGAPDIIACSEASSRNGDFYYLATYLNNGQGVFAAAATTLTVTGCSSIVVGDATGDGKPDVVIGYSNYGSNNNPAAINTVQIYPGLGNGMLGTPVTQSNIDLNAPAQGAQYANCYLTSLLGGTFEDSSLSILVNSTCVALQANTTSASYGTTFVGLSYGESKFTFSQQGAHPWAYLGGSTADLNNDGQLDALFFDNEFAQSASSQLYGFLNQGGGKFTVSDLAGAQSTITGASAYYTGAAAADFNGDGILDVATINQGVSGSNYQGSGISILTGIGKGQFTPSQSWSPSSVTSPATAPFSGYIVSADFNGDGKPDLAAVSAPGVISIYLNTMETSTICPAPSTANTNLICSPSAGASATSPVTVTAASNVSGFTLNRLYLDNVSVYQVDSQSVSTPIQASIGTHNLVLVSYNNKGQAFTASRTFTISAGGDSGCLPSTTGVNICSPATGAVLSTAPGMPITLNAGALTTSGFLTAIRFYEDDAAIATIYNSANTTSFQGTTTGLVTEGTHTLKVVAYTSTGAALTKSEPFTVQLSGRCLPSGAGAVICSPVQNQIVPTTLNVSLGAQVTTGNLTGVRLYVDNQPEFFTGNGGGPQTSYTYTAELGLVPGTHNIVLVAYTSTGTVYTASTTVVAQ